MSPMDDEKHKQEVQTKSTHKQHKHKGNKHIYIYIRVVNCSKAPKQAGHRVVNYSKAPKQAGHPKKKKKGKKKEGQANRTRELSFRSIISTLFRHWRILASRCSSLSSLHCLICLNLLVNCLKIQVLQICLRAIICSQGFDPRIKLIIYRCFKELKNIKNILFVFKKIEPGKFGICINKKNIILKIIRRLDRSWTSNITMH